MLQQRSSRAYHRVNQFLDTIWTVRQSRQLKAQPLTARAVPRLVLGIETSCDDTGAAVVTTEGRVLGEAIATQADIHAKWGGVVPSLAMDAHQEAIDRVVEQALAQAGVKPEQLHAVAVTVGPGLSLCLKVGVTKARQLSRQYQLPYIPVHHMEGHALVARLPQAAATSCSAVVDCTAQAGNGDPISIPIMDGVSGKRDVPNTDREPASSSVEMMEVEGGTDPESELSVAFPFICLLVSGGHNLLLLVKGVGQYVQLGTTLDDALGEAYDKIARLLGLELKPHGGAALEALATKGNPKAFKFSVPMRKYPNCDFSYAGLKTSVRLALEHVLKQHDQSTQSIVRAPGTVERDISEQGMDTPISLAQSKADIAASFQYIACVHLTQRVKRGIKWAKESVPELK